MIGDRIKWGGNESASLAAGDGTGLSRGLPGVRKDLDGSSMSRSAMA